MIRTAALLMLAAASPQAAGEAPSAPATGQAAAAAVALPFAPPTGRALRYELTQVRTQAGTTVRATAVREVRFDAEGGGFVLTMRLSEASTDAPGPAGDPFRQAMAALSGIDFRFHVDGTGKVGALENFDAVRAALQAARDRQRTEGAQTGAGDAFDRLIALPRAQLDRIMRLDAEQLLAYAGRRIDAGRPETETSRHPSPLGGTIEAVRTARWTIADADSAVEHVEHRSGDAALYDLIGALAAEARAAPDPAARRMLDQRVAAMAPLWFEETGDTQVSRHWGLPVRMTRVTRRLTPDGEVRIEEVRRFGDFLR